MSFYFTDRSYKIAGIITSLLGVFVFFLLLDVLGKDRSLDRLDSMSKFSINLMLYGLSLGVIILGICIYKKYIKLGYEKQYGDEFTKKSSNFIGCSCLLPIVLGACISVTSNNAWVNFFKSISGWVYLIAIVVFWYVYISDGIYLWRSSKGNNSNS